MTCGIYKITNKINNKSYIGQSVFIEERWKEHKENAWDKISPLYEDMRKYGIKNFSFNIIEECDTDLLNEKEKYWISFYNSYLNGYNKTKGGDYFKPRLKKPKYIVNDFIPLSNKNKY